MRLHPVYPLGKGFKAHCGLRHVAGAAAWNAVAKHVAKPVINSVYSAVRFGRILAGGVPAYLVRFRSAVRTWGAVYGKCFFACKAEVIFPGLCARLHVAVERVVQRISAFAGRSLFHAPAAFGATPAPGDDHKRLGRNNLRIAAGAHTKPGLVAVVVMPYRLQGCEESEGAPGKVICRELPGGVVSHGPCNSIKLFAGQGCAYV